MSHVKNQTKTKATRDELDKFVVRLPEGMRERIAELAKEQLRSMNMEIICRLKSSMQVDDELRRLRAALDDAQDANRTLREQNRSLAKDLAQALPKITLAQEVLAQGATA